MEGERYIGERRALRHFLQELRPVVVDALGPDSVLRYLIDRALRSGDLMALRKAREIFHKQPHDLKRRLMRGIYAGEAAAVRPSKSQLLERYTQSEPEPFVRFDAYPAANSKDLGLSVELEHELADDVPVRVLVSPGTLPTSAAEALRQIAEWIERDRRLLSARHWRDGNPLGATDGAEPGGAREPEDRRGSNVDQA
ncbi:MAG: hypothetical protein ACREH6_00530 [Geminicoccaceae bacterium]